MITRAITVRNTSRSVSVVTTWVMPNRTVSRLEMVDLPSPGQPAIFS